MQTDPLTDPRLSQVPFMRLKSFLRKAGVSEPELFAASTKFALVVLASDLQIKLEPLLKEHGKPPKRKSSGGRESFDWVSSPGCRS